MRKESLKKNLSTNGVVDDANADNDVDMNGGGGIDADPLQGADQPALDIPKKKGRKKNDTVTEVAVPIANKDDGDYEVDDIIDHKFEKKNRFFLVRWKNCTPDDDTWEPESSLACPDIVKKYFETNPDAQQVPGATSSRKRPANKEKPAVPAKKSKDKNTSATTDTDSTVGNNSNADDNSDAEDKSEAANGDGEYEVENIVDHKISRGKTTFLIRWKNYDASGDTWEPESSLSCPEIIANYKELHMKDVTYKPKSREAKPKKDKAEKEYEVQLIVDEKMQDGVKHYLVRWRGYKWDDDTWEPEHSLNCPDLISKFHEFKKNKRPSGARGTPKKLTYTEVDETEGEDVKQIYVNGSSSKSKSKSKSKQAKGKKSTGKTQGAKKQKEEEDYEVEEIVGEKMEKGKKYYFLKWKGWPSSNNTWEIATSLACPDVLKKYQAKLKSELQSSKTPTSPKASKSTKSAKKSKTPIKISKATSKKSKSPSKSAKASKAAKSKKKAVEEEEADEEDDNDDQDWEVEKIIDVRYNDDGSKEFQIRWKGCDSSQDTWEPENNVNSPDLVNAFMNKTDDTDDVVAPKKKSRKA